MSLRCTRESILRNSTRLSRWTQSRWNLSFELTTEGLVAGCGPLVLKSIKRSVINIRRSMLGVQSFHCPGQTEFHTGRAGSTEQP